MRKAFIFSAIFLIIFTGLTPLTTKAAWIPPTEPVSNTVFLINSDNGTVLYAKNADQKIFPASTTKIMTAILTAEKFKDKLNTVITVENADLKPLLSTDSSLSEIKATEKLTVEQLLYCMMLPSGNDAAMVLARAVGGDVTSFVEMMNSKAKELGCKNTNFSNPTGLHDVNHYTTAQDLYLIAKYAMTIDTLVAVVNTTNYTIAATATNQKHSLKNTNKMLLQSNLNYCKYVKGIKTGFTTPAGDCLVSYAQNGGYNYFCIVMGAPRKDTSTNTSFADTKSMYLWAFGNFEIKTLVDVGMPQDEIILELAWNKSKLQLVADGQFSALIPKASLKDKVTVKPNADVPKTIMAPVKKGQKLGTADVMLGTTKIGTINLVANQAVARSSPLYFVYLVGKFFSSLWFKIVSIALLILLSLYITISFILNRRKKVLMKRKNRKYKLPK